MPGRGLKESRLASLCARHADKVLTLVPLAVLIWAVARYAVDVPFLDQWDFVLLLDKMYQGQLTFQDLWAQFNEHRGFFPKLILLGLARLTGWNIRCETAVNVGLAIAIFLVLSWQIRQSAKLLGGERLRWAVPACSLVVFSMSQYENWLWGWQLGLLLGLLTALGSILLLANQPLRWGRFAGAVVLGIVATFTFANAVLVWPIGLALLCWLRPGGRARGAAIGAWILAAVLCMWLYLRDYQKPAQHPALNLILDNPAAYAGYFLKFIGSTCAQYGDGGVLPDHTWALLLGLGGLTVLGWAGWNLLPSRQGGRADRAVLAPYLAMCAYSLGTALMTATARAGFGQNQSLASRYCSLTGPLWFSLIVLLMLLSRSYQNSQNAAPGDRVGASRTPATNERIAQWLLLGVISFLTFSSGFGVRSAKELSRHLDNGRRFVLALATNPSPNSAHDELWTLFPSPKAVVERYPVLVRYRLSTFRD